MSTLTTLDDIKAIRETLCLAQHGLRIRGFDLHRVDADVELVGRLIDDCDRQRPLGPDGKHGDLHTSTCGCDDNPRFRLAAKPGPCIVITREGRMSWIARVEEGILQESDPAFAFTRRGAERKGRRRLARWVKRRNPERYVIRP